jgi:VIT1/CCC1 family predicted Fe2+/Mn2+ transporter
LREIVLGLNDGLVTTLVFLMTVSTLAKASTIVLIAFGEIAAGGISMALGGYLSARTEHEVLDQRIATERWEISHEPDEERAELRAIYRRKGLPDELLERVVGQLTADEERWLRAQVHDELGLVEDSPARPAWQQGSLIGLSFVLGGLVPTLAFLLRLPQPRLWAYGLTAVMAVGLGTLKNRYTGKGLARSSLEFLTIVTIGTVAGVVLGALLQAI